MKPVWQPNFSQWRILWAVSLLLILCWPPEHGRSLAVKTVNWLADPQDSLPVLPTPLPMGLDDNGDAVAAHDAAEQEYYRRYNVSQLTRTRMRLKAAADPLETTTQRQILAGLGILSALAVWRFSGVRAG